MGRRRSSGEKGQNGGAASALGRQDQRKLAAGRRSQLAPLKKQVQSAEQAMAKMTVEIAKLDKSLADPNLYTRDPSTAKKLAYDRGRLAKDLTLAEETWLSATEAYEAAEAEAAGA